jgi:hypothetical protein
MAYRWPDETVFSRLELHVEEQWCQTCGGRLRVGDHRHRRVFTLHGPLQVVCKLVHCPDRVCPAHPRTLSPEAETALAMPWWVLGWDVVCWLGHRRFARHWAVGQLRTELAETYQIRLSDDAIGLCRKVAFRRQNLKMGYRKINGLRASTFLFSVICDRAPVSAVTIDVLAWCSA